MSESSRLRQLFSDYASGAIDRGSLKDLESALRVDAELRREFIEYLNLDSALGDLAALSKAELQEIDSEQVTLASRVGAARSRSRRPFALAGIAVAAAILTSIVWFRPSSDRVPSPFSVAVEVLAQSKASIAGVDRSIQVGQQLEISQLTLTAGTIRLRLATGVELDLFAPLNGVFESQTHLRLVHGRLNADVGVSGQGFTVMTGAGEIVDLGTRFGVDVADGEAKVAVFEGEVAINQIAKGNTNGSNINSSSIRIVEGEGVRLRSGRRPERLSTVNVTGKKLRFSAPSATSVVTEVTDNADASDFRRFYGVVSSGMRDGTIAYTSIASTPRRDIVWRSMPGEAFPAELVGADVVCPFHTDRLEKALTISLHLSQPATVFIMHDARRPPPHWLRSEFQETDQKVRSGPWRSISPVSRGITPDSEGDIFVEYSVWKKDVENGLVELGAPHAQRDHGYKAMYGIAVRPHSRDHSPRNQTQGTSF